MAHSRAVQRIETRVQRGSGSRTAVAKNVINPRHRKAEEGGIPRQRPGYDEGLSLVALHEIYPGDGQDGGQLRRHHAGLRAPVEDAVVPIGVERIFLDKRLQNIGVLRIKSFMLHRLHSRRAHVLGGPYTSASPRSVDRCVAYTPRSAPSRPPALRARKTKLPRAATRNCIRISRMR